MAAVLSELYLSPEEIEAMTEYKLPSCQMRALRELGVKATLLRGNIVRVLRRDVLYPAGSPESTPAPRLKSSKKR